MKVKKPKKYTDMSSRMSAVSRSAPKWRKQLNAHKSQQARRQKTESVSLKS